MILSTTACVKNELKLLGSKLEPALELAEELKVAKCFHPMAIEPSICFQKHLGSLNKRQYILATCDKKLIKFVEENVTQVPIMTFVSSNVLEMREPSIKTKNLLLKNEKDKFGLAKHEVEKVMQFKAEEQEVEF